MEAAVDLWTPDTTLIRHLVTDTLIIAKEDDHAEGVSYYMAINHDPKTKDAKLPLEPFSMGELHDKYVKTPQGWRFAHREVKPLFQKPGGGH